ncbi:Hypothetical protein RMP42_05840 [Roseomonas mucosa]|nr:Hypothetical protein RMP42_05840 [Roseomonas mucosa]
MRRRARPRPRCHVGAATVQDAFRSCLASGGAKSSLLDPDGAKSSFLDSGDGPVTAILRQHPDFQGTVSHRRHGRRWHARCNAVVA